MADNEFDNLDDLLESFMNNSQKVYNEDKNAAQNKRSLPSSYNTFSTSKKQSSQRMRKKAEKQKATGNASNRPPIKEKSTAQKVAGKVGKVFLALLIIFFVVATVCFSVIAIYGYTVVNGDPVFDLTEEAMSQNQTSFIYGYDSKGKTVEITRLHGEENRIWLSIDDMNEYMIDAVISAEDKRFRTHHGVDWIRLVGIIVKPSNLGQGGSTITQQLIKNLTDENEVTIVRKYNEILYALNIEKHYSKDQILEAYLNTIYLSRGCYGVNTAAEVYFGKDVKDLNIAECATLASITQFPSRYDPMLHVGDKEYDDLKEKRRRWIMNEMYLNGFISEQEFEDAKNYELIFTNSKNYKGSTKKKTNTQKTDNKINSYYTDFVIDQVLTDLQKMGYGAKKAKDLLYGGGLKIYTAIDFDVQNAIEDVYENYRRMPDETVQGACVVMDYHGRVLGIVGGTGEKKANRVFNRASQAKRQPGSTIKPLSVYAPALEKSLNEDDCEIYWSSYFKDAPLMNVDGKPWPTNEGGVYSSRMTTLQRGLANSMNTISARTLDTIGVDYSYDFITNKFHISTLDDVIDVDYAPMATGSLTNGVTPLEMTTAYQAFGNGGKYYEPYSYYKIVDAKGEVLIEKEPEENCEEALSETTAGLMNKLLQTVMTQGTGRYYKISGVECFGKTGTTTDNKDRWFIGGTPEYIGGVWYGYDIPKEVHYSLSYNPSGTLWNLVMQNIYEKKGYNEKEFDTPDGIVQREYSTANGMLCRGTGTWGWYDENNLPRTTTFSYTTESTTKSTTDKNNAEGGDGEGDNSTSIPDAKPEDSTKPSKNNTTANQGDDGESEKPKDDD